MEYFILVILHIFFGIFWVGAATAAGFFLIPAIMDAGPGAGAVMAAIVKRKFPIVISAAAVIVVLSGARLYMIRYSPEWLSAPEGIVLTLGALLGIAALGIGLGIQKPLAEKLGALGARIAASGKPPTPAEAAELQALRQRLARIAKVTAWHLLAAALLMASHRLAASL